MPTEAKKLLVQAANASFQSLIRDFEIPSRRVHELSSNLPAARTT